MRLTKREVGDSSGGVFLKFKDGESRVGVLRGEVYEFHQVWENGKARVVTSDYPGGHSRFRLNFITKEGETYKAKIFEFGVSVYNELADLGIEYTIEKTAVKITRRGTGTDTVYSIIPSRDQPSKDQIRAIESVELQPLEHKRPQPTPPPQRGPPSWDPEDPGPEF